MTRATFCRAVSAAGAAAFLGAVPAAEPSFAPAAVQGDLDAIWTALLEVGAQPFRTSDRARVEALYRSVRASIVRPMTLREAWLAIASVLGALNDGHVGVGFPDALNVAAFSFPLFFGLSDGDGLTLRYDRSKTIPIGSEIESVNGILAADYVRTALSSMGAQTAALHRSKITTGGAWPAVALFGTGPVYRVEWVAPDGTQHRSDVAVTNSTAHGGRSRPKTAPYTFTRIADGSVGYVDYRSCQDLPRFQRFLDTTFSSIAAKPVRALVIDIRRNGGGDSSLNDLLWQYAADKAFKQAGAVIEKSCGRLKTEYGRKKYVDIYDQVAWDAPDGKLLTLDADPDADLIVPKPLAIRYKGPVYLLISTQTFSSAMSCALAAKDYGLATIVGEETGEPVNSTGEVYVETTPSLGLPAYLTTKVFLAPKPHPDGQGVVPDIGVATTTADLAAGRDPVMERVLALIG